MAAIDDLQLSRLHADPTTYLTFTFSQSFTRPSDTNAYVATEAINNSTSAPLLLSQDLSTQGVPMGATIQITDVKIVTDVTVQLESVDVLLSGISFTPANDNTAATVPLAVLRSTSFNRINVPGSSTGSRSYTNGAAQVLSGQATTLVLPTSTLYVGLVAAAGRTPVAGETFTVTLMGRVI